MDNGFQFFDIILFAAIAGFLLLRLRSVLGRRTGAERRRPDPFARPNPVTIAAPVASAPVGALHPQPGLTGVAAVKAGDPAFDEAAFLKGVRGAFTLVVNAFAAGDTAALQPLLNPDVFHAFSDAIRERQTAKETLQTTLVSIKSADIVDAAVESGNATVTCKLVSEQINVTRDADGKAVEGDPDKVVEKTDLWSFSRALNARDPNWTLVATHSS